MRHAFLRSLVLPLGALAALLASACGSNTATGTGSTGTGTGGVPAPCPDNLAKAPNSEFCEKGAPAVNCTLVAAADKNQVCGVPLRNPTADLKRSATVKEFGGAGPAKLDCFTPAGYPPKADPASTKTVQMSGTVKIFANGCESKLVKIEVFEVGADGALGAPAGTALTTASECSSNGVASDHKDCDKRYECNYIYAGVPTEKELVIRTSGTNWSQFYDYNIFIPNAEVMNGEWKHDLRALASDDYNAIAQAAIGGPITAGNGAVAGEVHDCGDVRLQNAIVAIDQPKKILTYFTSDEADPLPDLTADGTSSLGIYAALDVAPGPVTVAAVGNVAGKLTTLGHYRAQVFPNAVTIVTFRGVEPFQVP
jgi:hypothetical protein